MKSKLAIFIFVICSIILHSEAKKKLPIPFKQKKPHNPKYDNPDYIRDRERDLEAKAFMKLVNGTQDGPVTYKLSTTKPAAGKGGGDDFSEGDPAKGVFRPSVLGAQWNNRFKSKWHPAWMDYCDPYHCNDYHKVACGLNRKFMKFRWFQSGCHITLHNFCAYYRGALKYDAIEQRHCVKHIQYIRSGCHEECDNQTQPICGASTVDNHVVLFQNPCWMHQANCRRESYQEYEPVGIDICEFTFAFNNLKRLSKILS